jgi:two-component sensor histidine kinase
VDSDSLLLEDGNPTAIEMLDLENPAAMKKQQLNSIQVSKGSAVKFWSELIQEAESTMAVREAELISFQGRKFWGSLALTRFSMDDRQLLLLRISDISRQKESEEHIIQSLHEKEILIQEIHHRVKNNMAVISSLLQLQSGYFKDPALAEVFRDSQNRIKSMALIHEKLYQSSTLSKVEMDSYIRELTRTLYYTYSAGRIHLDVNTEAGNVFLDINSAVPCGLIINEVFSNSCKHAFQGMSTGRIDIRFVKEEDVFALEMRDNGVGLPPGTDPAKVQSLGMNLIQALSSQLGASLEYLSNPGFGIRLRFVEKSKPSREKVLPGR